MLNYKHIIKTVLVWTIPIAIIQGVYMLIDILEPGPSMISYSSNSYDFSVAPVFLGPIISSAYARGYKWLSVSTLAGTVTGAYKMYYIAAKETLSGHYTMTPTTMVFFYFFIGAIIGLAIELTIRGQK